MMNCNHFRVKLDLPIIQDYSNSNDLVLPSIILDPQLIIKLEDDQVIFKRWYVDEYYYFVLADPQFFKKVETFLREHFLDRCKEITEYIDKALLCFKFQQNREQDIIQFRKARARVLAIRRTLK